MALYDLSFAARPRAHNRQGQGSGEEGCEGAAYGGGEGDDRDESGGRAGEGCGAADTYANSDWRNTFEGAQGLKSQSSQCTRRALS